ncbi:MAG TPA: protoheme IX farnesyltransferase [Alphaproteobacteria bacterium]|nr:protoheme IX farnesyltransferase [Alphaproteobacteria bacterium]
MEYTSSSVRDFYNLMKPRVMSLVIFTSFVGLVLSPVKIHPFIALISILCIAIGAGASGVLNMWYDSDIDRLMKRTINRPIPAGNINKNEALTYGMVISAGSVVIMGILINWSASFLLAFTIFFYAVIYTMWLKRRTMQNIVIGGAAGAFPPIIGWLSTGAPIAIEPLILFFIIFLWTPPHFWALALYKDEDYRRANVPMLPVVHGRAHTKHQIVFYAATLLPLSLMPTFMGWAGIAYGVVALVTSCWFFWSCFRLYGVAGEVEVRRAKKAFGVSIIYLFAIFIALLVDGLFHVA